MTQNTLFRHSTPSIHLAGSNHSTKHNKNQSEIDLTRGQCEIGDENSCLDVGRGLIEPNDQSPLRGSDSSVDFCLQDEKNNIQFKFDRRTHGNVFCVPLVRRQRETFSENFSRWVSHPAHRLEKAPHPSTGGFSLKYASFFFNRFAASPHEISGEDRQEAGARVT